MWDVLSPIACYCLLLPGLELPGQTEIQSADSRSRDAVADAEEQEYFNKGQSALESGCHGVSRGARGTVGHGRVLLVGNMGFMSGRLS